MKEIIVGLLYLKIVKFTNIKKMPLLTFTVFVETLFHNKDTLKTGTLNPCRDPGGVYSRWRHKKTDEVLHY